MIMNKNAHLHKFQPPIAQNLELWPVYFISYFTSALVNYQLKPIKKGLLSQVYVGPYHLNHTHTHTLVITYTHTHIHIHACTHARTHAHTHTRYRNILFLPFPPMPPSLSYMCKRMLNEINKQTSNTHTNTHTHTHTHTRTHTHTYTQLECKRDNDRQSESESER